MMLLLLACSSAVSRGEDALSRDDLLTAEKEFRAAVDAAPEDPEALYGLGWTFHLAGEEGPAKDVFTRLVRIHPDLATGYRGLGSHFVSEGNLAEAEKQLGEALARAPDDPAANQSMALLELGQGKAEAALARVDAALGKNPESAELEAARAMILTRVERPDEAREAAAAAVAHARSARVLAAARIAWVNAVLQCLDDRVDAGSCDTAAPPLRVWLDAADHVLDQVEAGGALQSTARDTRRMVRRRRGWLEDLCAAGSGK